MRPATIVDWKSLASPSPNYYIIRMAKQSLTVLIEKDQDGYYVATVPTLKSCYTQAKTLRELDKRIREVIELCLEEESAEFPDLKFINVKEYEVARA